MDWSVKVSFKTQKPERSHLVLFKMSSVLLMKRDILSMMRVRMSMVLVMLDGMLFLVRFSIFSMVGLDQWERFLTLLNLWKRWK